MVLVLVLARAGTIHGTPLTMVGGAIHPIGAIILMDTAMGTDLTIGITMVIRIIQAELLPETKLVHRIIMAHEQVIAALQ